MHHLVKSSKNMNFYRVWIRLSSAHFSPIFGLCDLLIPYLGVLMSSRPFVDRHLGPSAEERSSMLQTLGISSLEELQKKTIPTAIELAAPLSLPGLDQPLSEQQLLRRLMGLAHQNRPLRSLIGQGYCQTEMPAVIQRCILENPGWYTAYTPYQAEISQGRLELLFHFQTLIAELSGFPVAGASLLDEATAAAEVMAMFANQSRAKKRETQTFILAGALHPQTAQVVKTRAQWLGIDIREVADFEQVSSEAAAFGVLVQNPDSQGRVQNLTPWITQWKEAGMQVAVACDILSLTLMTHPAQMGADAAVGSAQRLGLPMGLGGPHAGWMSTTEAYKRLIPGRIIGQSKDANGQPAYRMALQTREQHIRREKATSNICTAQVLPAVLATAYALYHGIQGLRSIAQRIQNLTCALGQKLQDAGLQLHHTAFFDTLFLSADEQMIQNLQEAGFEVRQYSNGTVSLTLDEASTQEEVEAIAQAILKQADLQQVASSELGIPQALIQDTSHLLSYAAFTENQTEHAMLRYLKNLENKDISLTHSMIPLGSCTMKLNAASEMMALSWSGFAHVHPYSDTTRLQGYQTLIEELQNWLATLTQLDAISLQPNSGAQGEYTGLLTIRAYQKAQGEGHRDIALIPSSAHGTNPASAALAGMKIVVVRCDEQGNIDIEDLKEKCIQHHDNLSALMITYPSTHGVFEENVQEVCALIHEHGGQVYMDGANMNAQVGITAPGFIGADVCHLNLHKTFAIPHGGGGPGSGPIGVKKHLTPYLPGNPATTDGHAVSAAPFGSGSILTISYAYIAMMGATGLRQATQVAILNANYLRKKLENHYPVLYTGRQGFCAHEFILDCRGFKKTAGIEVEDIAKRLMDYGFHAPTVSFPVPGTLMIEPTESEPLSELDRFAQALIAIRQEIAQIEEGQADAKDNLLKNAPHALQALLGEWDHPYSREQAAYPTEWLRQAKVWPSVGRIDNAYGDRNLICRCQ